VLGGGEVCGVWRGVGGVMALGVVGRLVWVDD
jgi:hypothetical protein